MAYSSPTTVVTATTITSTWGNSVKAAADYLANPPACRVTNSALQAIGTGAWTIITFDTEIFDTAALHSTVTNTGRFTAPDAGLYQFTGAIAWAANATGVRGAGLRKNGTGTTNPTEGGSLYTAVGAATSTYVAVSALIKLAANDWVELIGFQSSGVSLNTAVEAGLPLLGAVWVGLG